MFLIFFFSAHPWFCYTHQECVCFYTTLTSVTVPAFPFHSHSLTFFLASIILIFLKKDKDLKMLIPTDMYVRHLF